MNTTAAKNEKYILKPAGFMLSKFGLLSILAVLLLAAWFNQIVIVVLLGLFLATAGLSGLWSILSLRGVGFLRTLSETRVFPGEFVELRLHLINRKLLPLPWIQVEDEIPAAFDVTRSLPEGGRIGSVLLGKSMSLLWYTGVKWKEKLYCERRGYYAFGPARITSGDFFGFYPRSLTLSAQEHVIVYPEVFSIQSPGIEAMYPVGEITAERRIFEDPVRLAGVREYTPHDSLRHVHWKASARHQNLQVKVFEPTTTLKIAIFLAVDSFPDYLPESRDNFELGVSLAASVASHLVERRSAVGLYVNSCLADSGQHASILPGSSTEHLVSILEALAKVTRQVSAPFEEFLNTEQVTWGTTSVFIVYRPGPDIMEMLAGMKGRGQKVQVLQVGKPGADFWESELDWHSVVQIGDTVRISMVMAE